VAVLADAVDILDRVRRDLGQHFLELAGFLGAAFSDRRWRTRSSVSASRLSSTGFIR
jgi:hypothetical protein